MTVLGVSPASLLDVDRLVVEARRISRPFAGMPQALRRELNRHISPFKAGLILRVGPVCGWVDGAVASEQTDALVWTTAVGVATTLDGDLVARTAAVIPVCSDSERLRGLLMAGCEIEAAVAALDAGCELVFVDGGLTTSLMSVTGEKFLTDPDAAAAADHFLTAHGLVRLAGRYVDGILDGRIVALPKQDTAQVFVEQWAASLAIASPEMGEALGRMRDRPVIDSFLAPGEMLAPRPATLRIEAAGVRSQPQSARLAEFDRHLARLRAAKGLAVAYFKPSGGAQRTIKFEFATTPGHTPASTAARLAAFLDGQCGGPRVMEPFGQHMVDQVCKQSVRADMLALTATLTAALDDDTATRHYRS